MFVFPLSFSSHPFSASSDSDRWTATLTLGGEDNANCAAGTYVYAPVHYANAMRRLTIASVSLLNGTAATAAVATVAMRGTATVTTTVYNVYPFVAEPFYVGHAVFELFRNATGAVYSRADSAYVVDCESVAQLPRFALNFAASNDDDDDALPTTTPASAILWPEDYIARVVSARVGVVVGWDSATLSIPLGEIGTVREIGRAHV